MSTPATVPTRQIAFDYDRTVVAFHGTRRSAAEKLVAGTPFGRSENDDDWLGHGIYFWEYAPQQAWWWAERRYGSDNAAVVGSLVRLGRCIDLLDPSNADLLAAAHTELEAALLRAGQSLKSNANTHKYRDCAVSTISLPSWPSRTFTWRACARSSYPCSLAGAYPGSGIEAGCSAARTSSYPFVSRTISWRSGR